MPVLPILGIYIPRLSPLLARFLFSSYNHLITIMSCAKDYLNEYKLKKAYNRETAQITQDREIYQTFMACLPHLNRRWAVLKTKKQRQQKQMQELQEQQRQQLWGQLCVDAVEFYKLWIEAKKRFPNRIVVLVKGDFCNLSESVESVQAENAAASIAAYETDVQMTKSKPKSRNRQKRRREAAKARMETQSSETPQGPTVSYEDDAYVQAPIELMPKRKGGKPMFGKKGQKALARAQARALSQGS